jgi:hypothetical protein
LLPASSLCESGGDGLQKRFFGAPAPAAASVVAVMSRESIEKARCLDGFGLPDRRICTVRSINDKTRGVFGLSYVGHVPAMLRGRQRFSPDAGFRN